MKKIAAVLAVIVLVVSLASLAFAADKKKGVVKSVDAATGTVVLTTGGSDMTLKADKSVDLSTVKAGDKVVAEVENDTLTSMKKAKPRAAVGC